MQRGGGVLSLVLCETVFEWAQAQRLACLRSEASKAVAEARRPHGDTAQERLARDHSDSFAANVGAVASEALVEAFWAILAEADVFDFIGKRLGRAGDASNNVADISLVPQAAVKVSLGQIVDKAELGTATHAVL